MGRRTALLIASILVAAVGTVLVALYVRSADNRARADEQQVLVWVATKSVPAGTEVEAARSAFQAQEFPRRLAPEGAVRDPDAVRDRVITSQIYPGQPLVAEQLKRAGQTGDTVLPDVPPDKTLVPIKVDETVQLGGVIHVGSDVAVLVNRGAKTDLLFKKVKIHDILRPGDGAADTPGETKVMIEVDAKQAIQAVDASNNAKLTLVALNRDLTFDDLPEMGTADATP